VVVCESSAHGVDGALWERRERAGAGRRSAPSAASHAHFAPLIPADFCRRGCPPPTGLHRAKPMPPSSKTLVALRLMARCRSQLPCAQRITTLESEHIQSSFAHSAGFRVFFSCHCFNSYIYGSKLYQREVLYSSMILITNK